MLLYHYTYNMKKIRLIASYTYAELYGKYIRILHTGITPELDLIYMGMGITWEKAV